jgi:hypothetical protein
VIQSIFVPFRKALTGFAMVLAMTVPAVAQDYAQSRPLVVQNDRGGEVLSRLRQMAQLRSTGQRVQIVEGACYSSCTMLLGLPQICISPNTTFGFHGPSSYGRPLSSERFEEYSRTIAENYPPQLYSWYMSTARYSLVNVHRVKGRELIRMGVQAC